jgi:hypothetical protein
MTHAFDLDALLASGLLDPARARELLALPPALGRELDDALAARAEADAPALRAALDRLLALLVPPPALSRYVEQHDLSLWSRAAAGLRQFVAETELAVDELRARLFDAALATAPASLAPPPASPSIDLVIYSWAGREPPLESACPARVDWLPAGVLHVEAWVSEADSVPYPGLGRGHALLRVGSARVAPPRSSAAASSARPAPRRSVRGIGFPFPIVAAQREADGSGLHLSIRVPAPQPPPALTAGPEGVELIRSQLALVLFEAGGE